MKGKEFFKKNQQFIHNLTPFLLFGIFFIGTFVFWVFDVKQDQTKLKNETELLSNFMRSKIEDDISQRIELIEIFANDWVNIQRTENLNSSTRFYLKVPYYFEFFPGYLAINWINTSGVISWVYPEENNQGAVNKSVVKLLSGAENIAFSKARDDGLVGMTNVTTLFQGGMGLVTYHPLIYVNTTTKVTEIVGYFNVVFQINPLIEELIKQTPILQDFSFELQEFNSSVYHYQEDFDLKSDYCSTKQIHFYGRVWEFHLSPNSSSISNTGYFAKWHYIVISLFSSIIIFLFARSLVKKTELIEKTFLEKSEVETQLFQAQKMEALGTLAGGVAHDFNNILMGLQGNLFLLKEDVLDIISDSDKQKEYSENFADIEELTQRAQEMTSNILTFSRQTDFEKEAIEIKNLLKKTIKIFSKTIDKRIHINSNWNETPVYILGNQTKLHQIITNILVNSRDALIEGGNIQVSISEQPKHNTTISKSNHFYDKERELLISIKDDGVGMDEETLKHIFDPFFTTKKIGKGTGLGLSIVYRNVLSMDGFISVESQPGEGLETKIFFPIYLTNLNVEKQEVDTGNKKSFKIFSKQKILIAEDEKAISTSIRKYLQKLNLQVKHFTSGEDTLSHYIANADQYPVVILDVNLPDLNGIEIYNGIRTVNKKQDIIFITGYSQDKIPDLISPTVTWLQKPFKLEDLVKLLKQKLRNLK
ncbi:Sensor histidine kinase RcsC [Candidatus Lokiarchaeum ossiferum]|uniref:Sensor histidine kinase RcsC n=1 Tax=Candidatus Lokiarchaeum ossiferum TaxID=2951803 RepID=A0ABY6HXB3_9ARCH|nr:Sensor histidine kinase RcsC [Candidatus Lokiarchaeum sp. B-35]